MLRRLLNSGDRTSSLLVKFRYITHLLVILMFVFGVFSITKHLHLYDVTKSVIDEQVEFFDFADYIHALANLNTGLQFIQQEKNYIQGITIINQERQHLSDLRGQLRTSSLVANKHVTGLIDADLLVQDALDNALGIAKYIHTNRNKLSDAELSHKERFLDLYVDRIRSLYEFIALKETLITAKLNEHIKETYQVAGQLNTTLMMILFGGILLMFGVIVYFNYVFNKLIIDPVKRLSVATQAAAKGDLSVTIETEGDHELSALSRSFNQMIQDLARSHKALRHSNQHLDAELKEKEGLAAALLEHKSNLELLVTERTEELRHALQSAELANESKSMFLANMSHEIRTPMNAIIGLSELALKQALDDKSRNYISKVHQSAKNLLIILSDILDFTKMEQGQLEMMATEFSLSNVLALTNTICELKAHEKNITLHIESGPEVSDCFLGDQVRLGQVLINLVTNAIKFTPDGGRVEVSVTQETDQDDNHVFVNFAVRDNGIGMTADQQKVAFDHFSQADASSSRQHGGVGLGLAISKQIVKLMGGDIRVQSEPNVGSVFEFQVRLTRVDGPSVTALQNTDTPAITHALYSGLQGLSVLVVEDNAINQELVLELLADIGAQTQLAHNGEQALAMLKDQAFDLVLMDCQMPVMDGYEATRRIRLQAKFKDLPIIALTANVMKQDIEKVLSVGMNDHIAKPIDPDAMYRTMLHWAHHGDASGLNGAPSGSVSDTVSEQNGSLYALKGIDAEAGLMATAQNEALYRRLLSKFINNQAGFEVDFRSFLDSQDMDSATAAAHTLKGLAANLGMTELQQAALNLEMACRNDADDLEPHLDQVLDKLNTVFDSLRQFH